MKLIVSLSITIVVLTSVLFLRVSYLEQQASNEGNTTFSDYKVKNPVSVKTSPEPQVAGEKFIPPKEADPYVNCNIHQKCGGGTKYVRKNVCDTGMYCCFLNDGTSKLMTKYECDNYSVNNPQNVNPSSSTDTSYNYVPNYSNPPCTLYSAVLGYSTTYYIDTETCNKWKSDQEKSNQNYLNWKANSESSSTGSTSTYSQEQWLEDCKKMAEEMVALYGGNYEQLYNACLGGSTGSATTPICPGCGNDDNDNVNYEGTDVRYRGY